MRRFFRILLATAVVTVIAPTVRAPLVAQRVGPQPTAIAKAELLRLREAAWRTFFANDPAGFKRVVPGELLAMGWDGGPWQDRAQILAGMNEFAKSGQVIGTLEFPRTEFQQYGDAVILYNTFRLVLKSPDGKLNETKGRGTEVFVRKEGKWTHIAWHLDTVANWQFGDSARIPEEFVHCHRITCCTRSRCDAGHCKCFETALARRCSKAFVLSLRPGGFA